MKGIEDIAGYLYWHESWVFKVEERNLEIFYKIEKIFLNRERERDWTDLEIVYAACGYGWMLHVFSRVWTYVSSYRSQRMHYRRKGT